MRKISFWSLTTLCIFGIVMMIIGHYKMQRALLVLRPHPLQAEVKSSEFRPVPARTAATAHGARDAEAAARVPPTPGNQTLAEVPLHCKTVCSKSSGGLCVPLDLAVFVYKNHIPTENMTFDLQNTHPVVRLRRKGNATEDRVLEMERCSLEKHFPGVQLIPRQGSCAVVGNSGILNNSSCGDYIDSHDFVIRANMGLIKGYEADVGRTASLTAFNRALMYKYGKAVGGKDAIQREIRDQLLDHIHTLKGSILWYPKQLYQKGGKFASGTKYRSIIATIRKNVSSNLRFAFSWKPIHIENSWGLKRTGTLGFDLYAVARTFCSNITLFGFYPYYKDLEGRKIKYHYFDDATYNFSIMNHDFIREHKKLKELEKQGNLTLIVRDCKPRNRNLHA